MSASPTPFPVVTQNTLSLLDADPELSSWIAPTQREEARRTTRVPEVILKPGTFEPGELFVQGRQGFGALIVSGNRASAGGASRARDVSSLLEPRA